jgi:hypothetical protein
MMEFPLTDSPLRSALVTGAPTLADGHVVDGGSPASASTSTRHCSPATAPEASAAPSVGHPLGETAVTQAAVWWWRLFNWRQERVDLFLQDLASPCDFVLICGREPNNPYRGRKGIDRSLDDLGGVPHWRLLWRRPACCTCPTLAASRPCKVPCRPIRHSQRAGRCGDAFVDCAINRDMAAVLYRRLWATRRHNLMDPLFRRPECNCCRRVARIGGAVDRARLPVPHSHRTPIAKAASGSISSLANVDLPGRLSW